jgi:type IV secretory pathway TrbD component
MMESEVATAASKTIMLSGLGAAGIGWFTVTEWMAILGGISAFLGMVATFWYSRKDYKLKERDEIRRQELHDLEVQAYRTRIQA